MNSSELGGPSRLKLSWLIKDMCLHVWLKFQTSPRSSRPGWCFTSASYRPWGAQRNPKFCAKGLSAVTRPMIRSTDLSQVIRNKLVYHKYLFWAMGMQFWSQFWHGGAIGHNIAKDEVTTLHQGRVAYIDFKKGSDLVGSSVLCACHANDTSTYSLGKRQGKIIFFIC